MRWLVNAFREWWHWNGLTRCYACRRWFRICDFWNPWGPNKGPGLCCSEECCDFAKSDAGAGGVM